jgi:hypothetical protein
MAGNLEHAAPKIIACYLELQRHRLTLKYESNLKAAKIFSSHSAPFPLLSDSNIP